MTDLFEEFEEKITDSQLEEVAGLAREQLELERKILKAERELKALKEDWREVAMEELPVRMKEIGLTSFELDNEDHNKVTIKHHVKASLTQAKREPGHAWLRDHGFGDLIKARVIEEKVHPQTLMAFVREQLAAGAALPTDLFGVYEFDESVIK